VEEDHEGVGWDESGMAPEVEGRAEEEMEDLNVQPVGMDVHSDSPIPMSPRQAASLDRAVEEAIFNNQEPDSITSVLVEVPSTQPAISPPPMQTEPSLPRRVVVRALSAGGRGARPKVRDSKKPGQHTPTGVPPLDFLPPTTESFSAFTGATGRGILRLRAPPKVARVPAPRRRPPPCSLLPRPAFTIRVSPPPTVEFTAPTPPILEDSQPFTPSLDSSRFQDVDEPTPLTGTWAEIMEREEAQESDAAAAVSAALATLPAPVAAINAAAATLPEPQTPMVPTVMSFPIPPTMAAPISSADCCDTWCHASWDTCQRFRRCC